MVGRFESLLLRVSRAKGKPFRPAPLLTELFDNEPTEGGLSYERYPFAYRVTEGRLGSHYSISSLLPRDSLPRLREIVARVSEELDPSSVEPLSFLRLVDVVRQLVASNMSGTESGPKTKEVVELLAYEAIGLSRILAMAVDTSVTEFYVDSDSSPVYLDHAVGGRCSSSILLTEREREAIETHVDTFRGYSLDFETPSLKNDLDIGGARLRISLDLEPLSVNRFSLDVRRLNITSLSLGNLISTRVVSLEAAAFVVGWLEKGGNVTIIGETGTGKTTFLNALDEELDPRLRRVYIEDAVETRDMLQKGYHQMKLKVDPFDRGTSSTAKETEIVKVLHRSPDLVILSELQSAEHSRAFFHALSAGVRGIQTFHASTIEQAIRRWVTIHGIPEDNLVDLGLLVQMSRPDRLGPTRVVARVCEVVLESGSTKLREVYQRNRQSEMRRVADWERIVPPGSVSPASFHEVVVEAERRLSRERAGRD